MRVRRGEGQAGIEVQKEAELVETEKGNVMEALRVDI